MVLEPQAAEWGSRDGFCWSGGEVLGLGSESMFASSSCEEEEGEAEEEAGVWWGLGAWRGACVAAVLATLSSPMHSSRYRT